eukprot:13386662-Alexandrium_andersonii.AAC.1
MVPYAADVLCGVAGPSTTSGARPVSLHHAEIEDIRNSPTVNMDGAEPEPAVDAVEHPGLDAANIGIAAGSEHGADASESESDSASDTTPDVAPAISQAVAADPDIAGFVCDVQALLEEDEENERAAEQAEGSDGGEAGSLLVNDSQGCFVAVGARSVALAMCLAAKSASRHLTHVSVNFSRLCQSN